MSLKFSICIPVYKGSAVLTLALKSILAQSFQNFEILISDDNHPSDKEEINKTLQLINNLADQRIKYFKTDQNLGYAHNLKWLTAKAMGNIIFLFAQDDILATGALQKTHNAFLLDADVGAVTRPYFWYQADINKPIRAVLPLNTKRDQIVSIFDGDRIFNHVMWSVGQLSGLAYRREFLGDGFGDECFTAHIYPWLGIFKNHKVVFLSDYTVAVAINTSQTRALTSVYDISPTQSWIRMYERILADDRFARPRKWGRKHMAKNYVGLVQIRNYGSYKYIWREIWLLFKYRRQNLFNLGWWFFSLLCLLTPRIWLRKMTDIYKAKINSRRLPKIIFNYEQ